MNLDKTVAEIEWRVRFISFFAVQGYCPALSFARDAERAISNSHVESYQKNGITGNEIGTTVTITGNTVVGQGSTNGAAENSIQIAFGATGKITSNVAMDDVWES